MLLAATTFASAIIFLVAAISPGDVHPEARLAWLIGSAVVLGFCAVLVCVQLQGIGALG